MTTVRTWTRRLVPVLVLAWATFAAVPVAAHTRLAGTTPAAGSSVPAGTDRLVLSFSDGVRGDLAVVEVTGPDGYQAATGAAMARGTDVVQPLRAPLAVGAWEVAYRVLSGDGHAISGTFAFSVAAEPAAAAAEVTPAAEPTAGPAATTAPLVGSDRGSRETSVAPAGAGLAVLATAGGLLVLRQRRRGRDRQGV